MLTVVAPPHLSSDASSASYLTSTYPSSSPSSPGQTSTSSSDDFSSPTQPATTRFSHMLHADIKSYASDAYNVPPEMKCQYKTGTCTNMRTTKKNGKLLMLCELHRKKQNEIKKRSDRKQSAMRMNRRLEAKQKAMQMSSSLDSARLDLKKSNVASFKRTPKFEELLSCDANQIWEHHHQHQQHAFDSCLTLPRVNVWRTKDGIATSVPPTNSIPPPLKTAHFHNPFSPAGQFFDWNLMQAPPAATTTTGTTPRGNDLALLEFFLHD